MSKHPRVRPIYPVMMRMDVYDNPLLVRCFTDIEMAKHFASECNEYEETRPEVPELAVMPGTQVPGATEAWELFRATITKWQDKHPAGQSYALYKAEFFVTTTELVYG